MKKVISFILSLFLVGCSVKVNVDMNDYSIDIIEDEITLGIGESYRLTVRAPLGEYSWKLEGDTSCITLDSFKDVVTGVFEGKVVLEAYNNKGYKDEVTINVIKDDTSKPIIDNFAYVYDFIDEFGEGYYTSYFTNGSTNTNSFSVAKGETSKNTSINLNDYGVTSLIPGDSIELSFYGSMWVTSLYPAGDATIMGELVDIKYHPSEIYEVTLEKREMYEDSIGIGLNSSLGDFKLINNFVISKDEDGRIIKKELDDYEGKTKLYYSFNQLMNDPHVYSFLYDYNPKI